MLVADVAVNPDGAASLEAAVAIMGFALLLAEDAGLEGGLWLSLLDCANIKQEHPSAKTNDNRKGRRIDPFMVTSESAVSPFLSTEKIVHRGTPFFNPSVVSIP